MDIQQDTTAELRDLAARYAIAMDRRDAPSLLEVFRPDAVLTVRPSAPGRTQSRYHGHDEISTVPGRLRRYDKTFHFVGQSLTEVTGDRAHGEVYCIAHHLTAGQDHSTDHVMYLRYLDEYARGPKTWQIASRTVVPDWTHTMRSDGMWLPQLDLSTTGRTNGGTP